MEGSGRRPDVVGTAFGAFLLLAVFAVAAKLLLGADGGEARGLSRLLPVGGDAPAVPDAVAAEEERFSLGGPGLAHPLPPLYYDGPRELVAPAAHEPGELAIPEIGVRTGLLRLDKRPDGRMQVPGDFSLAGWYVRGPAPGQTGPAVLAGHLDSRRGPAVFARLDELAPGDEILVTRGDGHTVRFTVSRVMSYAKDAFPTAEVYGNTAGPELRLITCDGDFDRGRRSYEQNLVVYAVADPATLPAEPGPAAPRDTPAPPPGQAEAPADGSEQPPGQEPSNQPTAGQPEGGQQPAPAPQPSTPPSSAAPTPRPSESGLPTEEPTPSPRPSGGVPLP